MRVTRRGSTQRECPDQRGIPSFLAARWPLRWLAFLTILLVASPGEAAPLIDPSVAPLYVGQTVVLEGRVERTERDGHVVRLFLGPAGQEVQVALIEGLLSRFPTKPEEYYAGRSIRVSGTVSTFRNQFLLRVNEAAEILVLEPGQPVPLGQRMVPAPAAIPSPVPAPPAPALAPAAPAAALAPAATVEPVSETTVAERQAASPTGNRPLWEESVPEDIVTTDSFAERIRKLEARIRILERRVEERETRGRSRGGSR